MSIATAKRKGPPAGGHHRGIALIAVLWVVALLAIVAGAVSAAVRGEARLAGNLLAQAQARHAAEGALHLAILSLLAREGEPAHGAVPEREIGHSTVRVVIEDEAGKLDLNLARARLLDGLLQAVGSTEGERRRVVAAILDWRDADDQTRPDGAEDREYLAAGVAYGAKDAHFDSVEELQLVLGMSPALYRRLKPALTVHARRPDVEPRLASPLVRLALAAADESVGAARPPLPAGGDDAASDRRAETRLRNATYAIHAQARAPNGVTAHVTAIVAVHHRDRGAAFTILQWRADGDELFPATVPREGEAAWS